MLVLHRRLDYAVSMMFHTVTVQTNEKLHTMCEGHAECRCPIITGERACMLVALINTFVTETNWVSLEMDSKDYMEFRLYVSLASLRDRG
jgi:hypothetical protein